MTRAGNRARIKVRRSRPLSLPIALDGSPGGFPARACFVFSTSLSRANDVDVRRTPPARPAFAVADARHNKTGSACAAFAASGEPAPTVLSREAPKAIIEEGCTGGHDGPPVRNPRNVDNATPDVAVEARIRQDFRAADRVAYRICQALRGNRELERPPRSAQSRGTPCHRSTISPGLHRS